MDLNLAEARVLGALIEKDMSTPDYYPLTLNALTAAVNQKTNRDPVVSWENEIVFEALDSLRGRGLAAFVHESGSRVEKYRHKLGEAFNFTRGELAVLAVLMLRGPQTAAELRDRTGRLHEFEDVGVVQLVLEKLAQREEDPLTRLLPKLPGLKEPRWAHLLSGEPKWEPSGTAVEERAASPLHERIARIEDELRALREEFEAFKSQF